MIFRIFILLLVFCFTGCKEEPTAAAIEYEIPISVSKLEIRFPKANMLLSWNFHWFYQFGRHFSTGTKNKNLTFSTDPANFVENVTYQSEDSVLYFSVCREISNGFEFNKDSVNGWIRTDKINKMIDLRLSFYISDDYSDDDSYDNISTQSFIEMTNVPYSINKKEYIRVDLNTIDAKNYITDFGFRYGRSQGYRLEYGHEVFDLIELIRLEYNKEITFVLWF